MVQPTNQEFHKLYAFAKKSADEKDFIQKNLDSKYDGIKQNHMIQIYSLINNM